MEDGKNDEINDSPVEEVRLTVPTSDDHTLPALTFRTWFLGITTCCGLAFMNRFFDYRQNPVYISTDCIQILILPLGKLLAATLPTKTIRIPGTKWGFTMNPGPFNLKEHVLISIFANMGPNFPYPVTMMTVMKAFFHKKFSPWSALILALTSQMVGYGFVGLMVNFLVDSPRMWWPENLVQVSLFRTLHENEKRQKGQLTRIQFFILVVVSSFAYNIIPNYLFPSITALSFICWIWKNSVTAQQIGSARSGLGVGSFTLDYASVVIYAGNPFTTPVNVIINTLVGVCLFLYLCIPLLYWTNSFNGKNFPIFSSATYDADGHEYNISRVLDEKTFSLDLQAFNDYSKVYLSSSYALNISFGNAAMTAAFVHVIIYHGRSFIRQLKEVYKEGEFKGDIHNRLMRKYKPVPKWWYLTILVSTSAVAVLIPAFTNEFQLPVWGVIVGIGMSLIQTFPTSVIEATTGALLLLDFQNLLMGYLLPGKPLATMTFRAYGYITTLQAILFLTDLKLGHYMKIPPRSMFVVQMTSTLLSAVVNIGAAWWLLSTVKNICEPDKLPRGSPWTCPGEDVIYDNVVQGGVIGPAQLFVPHGIYWWTYLFYLVGVIVTIMVWKLSQRTSFKWVGLINVPMLLAGGTYMPPARPVHFWTWAAIGIFFNFYVYRKAKGWWAKYNYLLSAALNIGPAFLGVVLYLALNRREIYGVSWWGLDVDDHCPLAHCPTAPGIVADGCPVF